MTDARGKRAKLNIAVSLGSQLVTIVCGFLMPRLLIGAFGSEAYGATASISQFLAYVTLLEGGIGGVARAALYKPLATGDLDAVSAVVSELKRFFRVVAWIFAGYALVLAFSFKSISSTEVLDHVVSFWLVIVISISTFAQYFIGITNGVLLQAAQKQYVTTTVFMGTVVLNTLLTMVLVKCNCSLITVKLVSSGVFILRPVAQWLYVRWHYRLKKCPRSSKPILTQKWTGLGQHIAFFLHSNTDIAVLTLFADLKQVSVYAVYNMVVSHIQSLCVSFSSGAEAVFGDMLAKDEREALNKSFSGYETLLSIVAVTLFSMTAVLILPFVRLYTAGITDVDYYAPAFSLVICLASLLYCLRLPYHAVTIAAGHFKQTRLAAYGEVLINVGLSLLLVFRLQLLGVAIGTLAATGFRLIYYVVYLSKRIVNRKISLFLKRTIINGVCFTGSFLCGNLLTGLMPLDNYLQWALCAVAVGIATLIITLGVQSLFYWEDTKKLLKR